MYAAYTHMYICINNVEFTRDCKIARRRMYVKCKYMYVIFVEMFTLIIYGIANPLVLLTLAIEFFLIHLLFILVVLYLYILLLD